MNFLQVYKEFCHCGNGDIALLIQEPSIHCNSNSDGNEKINKLQMGNFYWKWTVILLRLIKGWNVTEMKQSSENSPKSQWVHSSAFWASGCPKESVEITTFNLKLFQDLEAKEYFLWSDKSIKINQLKNLQHHYMINANENWYIISYPTNWGEKSLITYPIGDAVEKQLIFWYNSSYWQNGWLHNLFKSYGLYF